MKILMLNCQGAGVGDYRHWIPAEALQRRGHDVWYTEGEGSSMDGRDPAVLLEEKAKWADVIHTGVSTNINYIGLLATAREYARRILGKNLPVLMDSDDDLLHVPAYNTGFVPYAAKRDSQRAALWCIRNGDALTVTTPPLVAAYEPFNHHISVLPNCVDPTDWDDLPTAPERASSQDIRIMFAGGIGRKADLDLVQDALEIVMRTRSQVRLFFMACMPDWAMLWQPSAGDPHANRAFFADSAYDHKLYRRIVRWLGIDIVLAPVIENDFNRAKSSIKVLESPFIGAAAVCSDFETYAEVPADCVLKASTTYEWKESLLALVDDPELRARKVARCREWVLEERSIDRQIHRWEEAYEAALARPVIDAEGNGMKTSLITAPPPGLTLAG